MYLYNAIMITIYVVKSKLFHKFEYVNKLGKIGWVLWQLVHYVTCCIAEYYCHSRVLVILSLIFNDILNTSDNFLSQYKKQY